MEQQLVRKTAGDDDVMIALNKKVTEWKVECSLFLQSSSIGLVLMILVFL